MLWKLAVHHARLAVLLAALVLSACTHVVAGTGDGPGRTTPETSETPVAAERPGPARGEEGEDGVAKPAGSAAARTYCDGVVPPKEAAEFFCADFDSPLLEKGWDSISRAAGGRLERTEIAGSAPFALLSSVSGSAGDGTLLWKTQGTQPFSLVTATLRINPLVSGAVLPPIEHPLELIQLRTSGAAVTFGYARGASGFDVENYVGYFVTVESFGGLIRTKRYTLATGLPAGAWTALALTWSGDGKVEVSFDGVAVQTLVGYGSSNPHVSVRVGARSLADFGGSPAFRFDDVEMAIQRKL